MVRHDLLASRGSDVYGLSNFLLQVSMFLLELYWSNGFEMQFAEDEYEEVEYREDEYREDE